MFTIALRGANRVMHFRQYNLIKVVRGAIIGQSELLGHHGSFGYLMGPCHSDVLDHLPS